GARCALFLVLSLGGKRLTWMGPQSLALCAAALVLGGLFIRIQRRSPEPIVPPELLQDRVVRPVLTAIFIIFGSYLALAVLTPIYFQVALGTSVSDAGLLMIPLMLASVFTANLAGQNTRKTGRYKRPPLLRLPFAIVALGIVAFFAHRLSPLAASALLMLAGLGVGPIFPCATVAAQNAAKRSQLGAVSGVVAFARALGGVIGVAAASALVLGFAAGALASAGQIAGPED